MRKDIKVLGIDLAKNIFQLHGTDSKGKRILKKRLTRSKFIEFLVNLPPCTIGIEACGGAHYWGRFLGSYGHTVKMMAPQFVKPYVMANKNDANDAAAIAEAVTRPNMRFVAIKTVNQQEILALHKIREQMKKQRVAQSNHLRGILSEHGIIFDLGFKELRKLPEILDLEENKAKLNIGFKSVIERQLEHFKAIEKELEFYEKEIELLAADEPIIPELLKINGVGLLSASAFVATIGDASKFKKGREVSAWLGLVPRQNSSGNNIRLGGISKRGNSYLRTLLIHGARSALRTCDNKTDNKSLWMQKLKERCGFNKASVAVANKHARILWALMNDGSCYDIALANKV